MQTNLYVEHRLQKWSNWVTRQNDGLGYRKQSIMGTIMSCKGDFIRGTGVSYMETHSEAEEIENMICVLSKQTPPLATVLRLHYCERGTTSTKARQMKVSRAQYSIYLAMAKQWLTGRLSIGYLSH